MDVSLSQYCIFIAVELYLVSPLKAFYSCRSAVMTLKSHSILSFIWMSFMVLKGLFVLFLVHLAVAMSHILRRAYRKLRLFAVTYVFLWACEGQFLSVLFCVCVYVFPPCELHCRRSFHTDLERSVTWLVYMCSQGEMGRQHILAETGLHFPVLCNLLLSHSVFTFILSLPLHPPPVSLPQYISATFFLHTFSLSLSLSRCLFSFCFSPDNDRTKECQSNGRWLSPR